MLEAGGQKSDTMDRYNSRVKLPQAGAYSLAGLDWRRKLTGTQNVQIPQSLFVKLTSFFDYLSFGGYTFPETYGFDCIYAELRAKQDKINLRAAYTNAILAKDDSQRLQAYSNYQKLKNRR